MYSHIDANERRARIDTRAGVDSAVETIDQTIGEAGIDSKPLWWYDRTVFDMVRHVVFVCIPISTHRVVCNKGAPFLTLIWAAHTRPQSMLAFGIGDSERGVACKGRRRQMGRNEDTQVSR